MQLALPAVCSAAQLLLYSVYVNKVRMIDFPTRRQPGLPPETLVNSACLGWVNCLRRHNISRTKNATASEQWLELALQSPSVSLALTQAVSMSSFSYQALETVFIIYLFVVIRAPISLCFSQTGGEMYFSDVYASHDLPEEIRKHKILWGERIPPLPPDHA